MNTLKLVLIWILVVASSAIAATNEPDIVLTPILGNCENGYGKAVWDKGMSADMPLGIIYEGYFKNKLPDSFGQLSHPEHDFVVVAEFKDGKQSGFGIILESNKLIYAGMMNDFDFSNELHITTDRDGGYSLTREGEVTHLLPDGGLERNQIYRITPTTDTNAVTGIYIPNDLDACFVELNTMLTPEFIEEIKQGSEEDMNRFHHGFGMWMRNNWSLWGGSTLSKWFNEKGIHHPDDMSGIIFDSFWRHLNNKPIKLEEQIKVYQEYWTLFDKQLEKQEESNNKAIE